MGWEVAIGVGVGVAGLLLNAAVILVSAIWAVGKINTTTATISVNVDHLVKAISRLTVQVEKLDDRLNEHHGRLIHLETATKQHGG